ncbi:MAG: lipid A biosynthesis lauroyl acyltransferase [Gammaproteobacteria bacterium]
MADSSGTRSPGLFSPRHWPTWFAVGLLRLALVLPYGWLYRLGRGLGQLGMRLAPGKRCIVETNLRLCFPQASETERREMVRECFASLGVMLFEIPLAWWGKQARLDRLVEVEGREHLQRALEGGRGVILLSAHLTTLELSGRFVSPIHPINVSYRLDKNAVFNRLSLAGRSRHYRRVMSRDDVRALIRTLKEGGALWFAPDENFPRENRIIARFMGVPAATNPATARFARLGRAAVVPFALYRRREGRGYRLVFLPPLEGFPSGDAIKDAQRVNDALTELVRRAPEQYLWIQKRFLHGAEGQLDTYDHCR